MPMIGDPIERTDIPDLIEPIVGVRGWYAGDHRLESPNYDHHAWDCVEHATCYRPPKEGMLQGQPHPVLVEQEHPAPDPNCTCGLYAFHSLDSLHRHYPRVPVIGIVQMWGACEVHIDGVRAEHMKICALSFPRLQLRQSLRDIKRIVQEISVLFVLAWVAAAVIELLATDNSAPSIGSYLLKAGISWSVVCLLVSMAVLGTFIIERQLLRRATRYYKVPIIPYRTFRAHEKSYFHRYGRTMTYTPDPDGSM